MLQKNGHASLAYQHGHAGEITQGILHFDGKEWIDDKNHHRRFSERFALKYPPPLRLLDIDGDGICEMVSKIGTMFRHETGKTWQPLPFDAPLKSGARFVDLNGDGNT